MPGIKDKLRVAIVSPGFVNTDFAESMTNPEMTAQIRDRMDKMGISPTRSPLHGVRDRVRRRLMLNGT